MPVVRLLLILSAICGKASSPVPFAWAMDIFMPSGGSCTSADGCDKVDDSTIYPSLVIFAVYFAPEMALSY